MSAYYSPGVVVTETVNPSLVSALASPSIVAIVGTAAGEQPATESLTLPGTTAVGLAHTGVDASSVVVTDYTGKVVGPGNYTIIESSDPDSVDNSGDETYTITRVASPSTSPNLAAGTGSLTGTYAYAVSFLNAGGETGVGPTSATIVVSGQGVTLSSIPTGAAGTTARKIYRIKSAGANADNTLHLVATINDNTTTNLSNETVADATANTAVSPPAGIASGDIVTVFYDFTDINYWQATALSSFGDFALKYGDAFDSSGNVASNLSYAARLAFLNGASQVIGAASQSSSQIDIQNALVMLENNPNIRIVVVADGNPASLTSLDSHVSRMNNVGYYRIGVAGFDGTSAPYSAAALRTAAQGINSEAIRLIAPSSFQTQNPVTGKGLNLGGQFMAAAVAGMYAGRDVEIPLTRKSIAGFTSVNDPHSATDLALDSQNGLLAILQSGTILQVRHDVTTAPGLVSTRESSVVRAKYEMAMRLKTTLDSAVIGLVAPSSRAILIVTSVITGVLDQCALDGVIADYKNVAAQVSNTDPTTIQAQFAYDPSWPINNIVVNFTINTSTGDFSLQ